ncbi:MAG: DUF3455 domain-containing protein [Tardiphaga sp.]
MTVRSPDEQSDIRDFHNDAPLFRITLRSIRATALTTRIEMPMDTFRRPLLNTLIALSVTAYSAASFAEVPEAIVVTDQTQVAKFHAEGAQVYECKADAAGKLAWTFREPIATLMFEGMTIGRHYAGPNWEYTDGSAVTGKATGNAPGTTSKDIPWLRLEAAAHRGSGLLSAVTTVQRIDTKGGALSGACDTAGALHSEPYSAEYVFFKKG